jgi:hypothetical protein
MADGMEQTPQIDLLDQHLKIEGLVLPKADGSVIEVGEPRPIDDRICLVLGGIFIKIFEGMELSGRILGHYIEREPAPFPAFHDQGLCPLEVTLEEAVFLEEVTPATGAHLEIECRVYFEDCSAEGVELVSVLGLGGSVLAPTATMREDN